jgi:hypothetical protein
LIDAAWNRILPLELGNDFAESLSGFQLRKTLRSTSMESHSFALIAPQTTAASAKENVTDHIEKELMRRSRAKGEVFVVRIAWAFACAVLLLMVLSLLLAVTDYAGSTFGPDLQPVTVSSSSGE